MTAKEMIELDAWIAEHVMGFESGQLSDDEIPHYTADPSAAMEVLKKCAEKNSVEIFFCVDKSWSIIGLDFEHETSANESTLELTICAFARKSFSK